MTRLKPILVVAVAAALLGLTGCTTASLDDAKSSAHAAASAQDVKIPAASLDSAAAALLPKAIAQKGELVVGIDPTFAPYEFYAADSKTVVGWDADFAKALGETLGVTVTLVPATFDTILPGVSSGKYDIGISGFNVTAERQKNADFAVYEKSGSALAVKKGNPKHLELGPLSLCGTTIGGEKGTSQGIEILPDFSKKCESAGKAPIRIQLFPAQTEANLALISGRVDGVFSGTIALSYAAKVTPEEFELAPGDDYEPTPVGIAMPKGSPLAPAITAAVKTLVVGDAYKAINAKYGFPPSVAVSPAEVTPEVAQ